MPIEKTEKLRQELILGHRWLAVSIARKFAKTSDEFLDYVQEGCIGLIRAYDKYDPNRPTKFSTLATYWVKKMVRQATIHRQPVVLPFNVYYDRQRQNQQSNQTYASTGERVCSEPATFNFCDTFDNLTEPEDQLVHTCTNKKLEKLDEVCQKCLSETECGVLRMKALGFKINEIGKEYGFSKQRASQIYGRAVTKIQENIKVDLPFPS